MATTTSQTLTRTRPPKPFTTTKLVCFSFAAYAKTVIDHLKSLNVPILPGLSDAEFASIEAAFNFTFPPDLRSILQEGLPVGPHFPNWRSSSPQQLHLLLNLPLMNLSKNIARNNFWVSSWGDKPPKEDDDDNKKATEVAKTFLDKAPVLVPLYRNCYIPSVPNAAGNPVFYVDDENVKVLSFDVAGFFQEVELLRMEFDDVFRRQRFLNLIPGMKRVLSSGMVNAPAWAATAARRVGFWTEVAEEGRRVVAREPTCGWWNETTGIGLRECLEEVFWRLRDGGWGEEEVKEMMMMMEMDGCDQEMKEDACGGAPLGEWSLVLVNAAWSTEDTLYSLDLEDHDASNGAKIATTHFQLLPCSCSKEDGVHRRGSIRQLINLLFLEV